MIAECILNRFMLYLHFEAANKLRSPSQISKIHNSVVRKLSKQEYYHQIAVIKFSHFSNVLYFSNVTAGNERRDCYKLTQQFLVNGFCIAALKYVL